MKLDKFSLSLVLVIVMCVVLEIGYNLGKQDNKAEIRELRTELKQAKEKIKVLEKNQTIVYQADSWGGSYD